jgi:hypothetical protein
MKSPASFFDTLPQYDSESERFQFDAPSFPVQCFPSRLKDIIEHFSEITRTPTYSNATAALSALGACCGGKRLRINSLPGKFTHANLYTMIASPSGMGRSETLRPWLRPIQNFQSQLDQQFEKEQIERITRIQVLEIDLEKLKRQLKNEDGNAMHQHDIERQMRSINEDIKLNQDKLIPPQLLIEDETTENLTRVLAANDEYAFSVTSEGKVIYQNLCGKYNEKGETEESLYLKAFSGDYCQVGRISRNRVTLNEPYMACLWLMQISVLQRILRKKQLLEEGLLPRFLFCICTDPIPEIDPDAFGPNSNIISAWETLSSSVLNQYYRSSAIFEVSIPRKIYYAFTDFGNECINRMNNGLEDVQSFVARWLEISFRIALVLHVAEHGPKAHTVSLSEVTAANALELIQYYAQVQMQLLTPRSEDAQFKRAQYLYAMLLQRHNGSQTSRVIIRNHGFKAKELDSLAAKFPHLFKIEGIPTTAGGTSKRIVSALKTNE